jgi:septum formation protein
MGIVLASGSPRRLELLKMIGIEDFKVIPDMGEEEISPGLSPEQTVCKIALEKATNVSRLCSDTDIIIAADTLVYLDGRPLSKPEGPGEAADMLRALSGRRHAVYTGLVLLRGAVSKTGTEITDVYFREIPESEISAYVKTGEPMDKAGAYGAQGRGAIFVERIEGDFFNVMGLPLCRLATMLKEFGVNII